MQINMLGSGYKKTYFDTLKSQPNPTIEDTNEYIMTVDNALRSIPVYDWDNIYGLSIDDRMKLCDMLRMTFLNHDSFYSYKRNDILHPQELSSRITNILKTDDILSEEQVDAVLSKTVGAYKTSEVEKLENLNHLHENQLQENLEFIRTLFNDENYPIFKAMSPKTLVSIIFNNAFSGDDLTEALLNLKFDEVLPEYSEDDFYLDDTERKATIHEYLTGSSYYKEASAIDKRLNKTFKTQSN